MSGSAELSRLAQDVATKVGEMVATRRLEHISVADTKSTDVDVVTEVDREAERLIQELLLEARPGDGLLGEEGASQQGSSGVTWVIDPIDGTVNFLYNIPHYAVSIAAVEGEPTPEGWDVQAGVVFNPATTELFHAAKGEGSFLGQKKLQVAPPVPLAQSLWLTGFAYAPEYRAEQGRLAREILPRVRDLRRMGTASLDLAAIAAGRANIYFERTLSPWDHAAGDLIVMEAGGIVSGFGSTPPTREAIFAGHPEMVAAFQRLVAEYGGERPLSEFL